MSHWVSIQTQVRDIEALRDACRELDVTVLENAQAGGFALSIVTAEDVVQLKGPYDIAFNRGDNGMFSLTTDWWDGHVEKEVGANYGKLLQLYGVHKTMREARRRGYTVRRQANKQDGSIKLVLGGGA